jgi:hypothetical protein
MKILVTLFVGYIGYRLGRTDLRLRPAQTALTIFVAAVLHLLVQRALPHETIERFASAAAVSWKLALLPIALLETAGIWIAVLAIPWAARETRIAASFYIMSAATLEILVFHQPFDVHPVNGVPVGPTHPDYLMGLVFSLVNAIIPFGVAVRTKRKQRRLRPATDAP